jgi:DNA-binding CsgD family transcriptional regulator
MSTRRNREAAIAALYQAGMGQLDWGEALAVLADGGVRHSGELHVPGAPGLRATVFGLAPGRAAVLLTDPWRHRDLPLRSLRQRFELTEAEARVVQRIAAGDTIRQAAERIGIGYETARTQLKSAMAKSGWRRQSEMLADVFGELLPFGTSPVEGDSRPG